jgi:hypothetical protein
MGPQRSYAPSGFSFSSDEIFPVRFWQGNFQCLDRLNTALIDALEILERYEQHAHCGNAPMSFATLGRQLLAKLLFS